MNEQELTKWAERNLMRNPPIDAAEMGKNKYVDLRFFSEYIPKLGMDTEIEYLHNPPTSGKLYFVVISSFPPGSLYVGNAKSAP